MVYDIRVANEMADMVADELPDLVGDGSWLIL
jgi:hypothetical protein